jgi:hypothetical protein
MAVEGKTKKWKCKEQTKSWHTTNGSRREDKKADKKWDDRQTTNKKLEKWQGEGRQKGGNLKSRQKASILNDSEKGRQKGGNAKSRQKAGILLMAVEGRQKCGNAKSRQKAGILLVAVEGKTKKADKKVETQRADKKLAY